MDIGYTVKSVTHFTRLCLKFILTLREKKPSFCPVENSSPSKRDELTRFPSWKMKNSVSVCLGYLLKSSYVNWYYCAVLVIQKGAFDA
jgi:hypothetical protein